MKSVICCTGMTLRSKEMIFLSVQLCTAVIDNIQGDDVLLTATLKYEYDNNATLFTQQFLRHTHMYIVHVAAVSSGLKRYTQRVKTKAYSYIYVKSIMF